eukprot:1747362-Amphidinium_carterae.1
MSFCHSDWAAGSATGRAVACTFVAQCSFFLALRSLRKKPCLAESYTTRPAGLDHLCAHLLKLSEFGVVLAEYDQRLLRCFDGLEE